MTTSRTPSNKLETATNVTGIVGGVYLATFTKIWLNLISDAKYQANRIALNECQNRLISLITTSPPKDELDLAITALIRESNRSRDRIDRKYALANRFGLGMFFTGVTVAAHSTYQSVKKVTECMNEEPTQPKASHP